MLLEIINYNTAPILYLRNATYPFALISVLDAPTLRTTEPMYNGQIITLLGIASAGIGSGNFRADLADISTADDNSTTIVTVTGKRWKRIVLNGDLNIDSWTSLNTQVATNASNIAGKANTVHTHAISDIVNLQSNLDAITDKTDNITVTQAVNLDTIESDILSAKTKTDFITVSNNINLDNLKSEVVANIATVAQLRTTVPTSDGQVIALVGHTTAGIGGGLFRYDASDTTTADDNGIVIVTSGGKRWKRILDADTVTPEMFGAIGDGITDDSTAFQKSVNTLKTVLLSQKTYIIGDILIPSKAIIDGQGNGRIYAGIISTKALLQRKSGCFTILDLKDSRGFILKNFGVDGVDRTCHGIISSDNHCDQGIIENVSVQQCIVGVGGITQTGYYSTMNTTHLNNVFVTRCEVAGIRNLIDCHLVNPVIADNYGNGIMLMTGHNSNHFTNPRIEWNRLYNVYYYEAESNCFVGGIIDRAYKAGLFLQNAEENTFNGTIIKRNSKNNINAEGERSNIVIKGSSKNNIINGSVLKKGQDDGGVGTVTPMYNIEWAESHSSKQNIFTGNFMGDATIANEKGIRALEGVFKSNVIENKKLIILGASLEEGMLPGLEDLINSTYAVNWTVIDLATSGNTSTQIKNRVDVDLDTYGEEGAYVLVHAIGNDVSNTRPYANASQASKDLISANMDYIFDAIISRGMRILPCNLSFRNYDGITKFYEEHGAKPYNDNILLPKIANLNSPYVYEDGTPFLDLYNFVKTNMAYLDDEVHLTTEGYGLYRQFVVDTVMKKIITGENPTQLPALALPPIPTITNTVPSGTKITVTWTMPDETNITEYQLEYKKTTDLTWSRGAVVTAPTKTYAVAGLLSETDYDIRVRASYVNNAGVFSTPVSETTTPPVILWNDTFTDVNGTSLLIHTADSGGTYQRQTGSLPSNDASVESNKLRPRSSVGIYRTSTAMATNNYEVLVTLHILSDDIGSIGVTARASETENTFYGWRYQRLSSTTADLRLIKSVGGAVSTLTIVNIPYYTIGDSFTLKLSVYENTLQGFVDDVPISSKTDTSITSAGCAGLRLLYSAGTTTGIHVDNFIVREG